MEISLVAAEVVDDSGAWVRRRASLVVWARVRVAVSWRRERGAMDRGGVFAGSVVQLGAVGGATSIVGLMELVRSESEDWQCEMRASREVTEACRRSMSAVSEGEGMADQHVVETRLGVMC